MMRRHSRLNEHSPSLRATSGSARDLAQELKTSFGGAEVRKIDSDVGVNNSHQCHIRKIEALCDHLGAEEDVHFPATDAVENLGVSPLSAGRVNIHPGDSSRWKSVGQQPLYLLRSHSAMS